MRNTTINQDTCPIVAVWHACTGGKFRVRLDEEATSPGRRSGVVLNDAGEVIGRANDNLYGGRGWCIETMPYAGYASLDQVEIVGAGNAP